MDISPAVLAHLNHPLAFNTTNTGYYIEFARPSSCTPLPHMSPIQMAASDATSKFREWLKTPNGILCMRSILTSRIGGQNWMEYKFTGAKPKTDAAFCGYVKIQRYR